MAVNHRMDNRVHLLMALALASVVGSGCAGRDNFAWKHTPEDFVLVHDTHPEGDEYVEHFKGLEGEGLRVHSFHNPRGGTLNFWGAALRSGLLERGYVLQSETAVESRNRVPGLRLDFRYAATVAGETAASESYYTAVLFVSDERRVVVQMAGDFTDADRARAKVPAILAELRVHGCKGRRGPCGRVP